MKHILSLSYGKDSLACLGAIEKLGWPLDRIVHAEVWATDKIPADLPPMMEFKAKADAIIKARWGFEVEHVRTPYTYEDIFYRVRTKSKIGNNGKIYGWPIVRGPWCTGELKQRTMRKAQGRGNEIYLGIAADEPERIKRHDKPGYQMPLVQIGWDEPYCRKWCEDNDLLSPIYTKSTRGGCWFCHYQAVSQMRALRKNYPELWKLMLKWDLDSPTTFIPCGRTVHDYDKRFALEDEGVLDPTVRFTWDMLNEHQLNMFTILQGNEKETTP